MPIVSFFYIMATDFWHDSNKPLKNKHKKIWHGLCITFIQTEQTAYPEAGRRENTGNHNTLIWRIDGMKTISKFAAAASLLAVTSAANAFVVFDAWQFTTSGGTTTNIGHLVLGGGEANVTQEVDAGGQPFVGAQFEEFGNVFSLTYTPESEPGIQDSGALSVLSGPVQVEFVFDGLAGEVIATSPGGGITYAFYPGIGTITLREAVTLATLATFDVISPSSGSFGDSIFAGGSTGTTSLTALGLTGSGVFADSTGTSLDDLIAAGELYALVSTNNRVEDGGFVVTGPCTILGSAVDNCAEGVVTSAGQFNIATVPNPGVLSLLGLGLVGLASAKRRKVA